MSATLVDIAKAANTSISTASRVLTGAAAARRISKATRERVMEVAAQLGYRPNLVARSLRTRKTNTIAVLVSDIANPWFGRLASLIEQHLHRRGYSLMVCNSGEDAELEQEYLRLMPQKGIDGLIIVPLATERESLMRHLSPGLPVVVVDRPIDGVEASITSDQQQASEILCDVLREARVRKVAIVHGPEHVVTHRVRAQFARGRFTVVCEMGGAAQLETGKAAWAQIAATRPDAVICTNNFLGQGVIEAMADSTYRPIVACFDDIPLMQLLTMPVVCSLQDVSRLAEGAVRMLLHEIETGKPSPHEIIPAHIVCNDAMVAKRPKRRR